MSKKKAKDILDFLTRRIGYHKIGFVKSVNGKKVPYIWGHNKSSNLFVIPSNSSLDSQRLTCNYASTCEDLLDIMLDYVEAGSNRIETDKIGDVFMPAHMTLDQLEIMMDLEQA